MSTIIDGIRRVKEDRPAKAESIGSRDDAEFYVLGGEHLGASIARRLQADGHSVNLVDETHDPADIPSRRGDPGALPVLEDAGVDEGSTVIVATSRDRQNLLVAQLVRAHFDVDDILVVVNAPDRYDLVAEAGHEPICVTTVLTDSVVEGLENVRPDVEETA